MTIAEAHELRQRLIFLDVRTAWKMVVAAVNDSQILTTECAATLVVRWEEEECVQDLLSAFRIEPGIRAGGDVAFELANEPC